MSQERQVNQRLGIELGELQTDNQQQQLLIEQLRQEKESLELNIELNRTNLQVLEREVEETTQKCVRNHLSPLHFLVHRNKLPPSLSPSASCRV